MSMIADQKTDYVVGVKTIFITKNGRRIEHLCHVLGDDPAYYADLKNWRGQERLLVERVKEAYREAVCELSPDDFDAGYKT